MVRSFPFKNQSKHRGRLQHDAVYVLIAGGRRQRKCDRKIDLMGCGGSSRRKTKEITKKLEKPKPWMHAQPLTETQLRKLRDEFWDTAPHYGGQKEIWAALRAAAESDVTFAQLVIDCAGIIVASDDMTTCYDEKGAKYELPKFVLSEPINLIMDS